MITPKSKVWSFVVNNYTQKHIDAFSQPMEGVTYIVWGLEGRNIQGVICFEKSKSYRQVGFRFDSSVYLFINQLPIYIAVAYAKKEGAWTELGYL